MTSLTFEQQLAIACMGLAAIALVAVIIKDARAYLTPKPRLHGATRFGA